jgi:myo-inositol-1(or 4)-monophosphatase
MDERFELAVALSRQAGALLKRGFGNAGLIRQKGPIDLVTEYDLQSERLILDRIRGAFPQDTVIAEESGIQGSGEFCWLVDPLDGTVNFAHGIPIFSVSIAVYQGNRPQFGVVFDPLRDELFQAQAEGQAWLNGRRLQVSSQTKLDDSLLVTGFRYDIRSNHETNLPEHNHMALHSQGVRRLGSAALDLAYVAAGRFDAYWELASFPWDWAAGWVLVEAAGGRLTTLGSTPVLPGPPIGLLASNGHIHQQVLEALRLARQAG